MKAFVVCGRELRFYFNSFIAYALIAVFLVLAGHFFYSDLDFFILFGGFVMPTGLWQFYFIDLRLVTMLILPLVTMRLFAEEKKLGTIELLWTYPIKDWELIAGKFLAAWVFFLIMAIPTAVGPAVFYYFHSFDLAPVLVAYLGLLLLGTAFIACGLFVSSLTENQVVSAMVTYGILMFFWFMTWNENIASERVISILLELSLFDRFFNFSRGVIDTKDIVFFVVFTAFFLLITHFSLGSRKWRGIQ